MNNTETISLESIIKKLSRIEWLDSYFSAKQRKQIFEKELKEVEVIFNKIHKIEYNAFLFDRESDFAHIKLVIIKSVSKHIEEKYGIDLQLRYPDYKKQKKFIKAEKLPISELIKECRKIVN